MLVTFKCYAWILIFLNVCRKIENNCFTYKYTVVTWLCLCYWKFKNLDFEFCKSQYFSVNPFHGICQNFWKYFFLLSLIQFLFFKKIWTLQISKNENDRNRNISLNSTKSVAWIKFTVCEIKKVQQKLYKLNKKIVSLRIRPMFLLNLILWMPKLGCSAFFLNLNYYCPWIL